MGVLEDAIRDHLDLKRRHGASEEEVEQKELEALGPARREFEQSAEEPAQEGVQGAEVEPELDQPAEPLPAEEPATIEPADPEAATRIHESPPIVDPTFRGDAHDFSDEEEEEEEVEDEAERRPPRDFDFD